MLLAGGLVGFLKAGSRISLITSGAFAVVLSAAALRGLGPTYVVDLILVVLLAVFAARYAKGKKFMPAGFMGCVTLLAMLLRRL